MSAASSPRSLQSLLCHLCQAQGDFAVPPGRPGQLLLGAGGQAGGCCHLTGGLQGFLASSKRALGHFTQGSERYQREEELPPEAYGKEQQCVPAWGPSTGVSFTRVQRCLQPESLAEWTRQQERYHPSPPVTTYHCQPTLHSLRAPSQMTPGSRAPANEHPAAPCTAHVCPAAHGGWSHPAYPNAGGRWTPTCCGGWPISGEWEEQNKRWACGLVRSKRFSIISLVSSRDIFQILW